MSKSKVAASALFLTSLAIYKKSPFLAFFTALASSILFVKDEVYQVTSLPQPQSSVVAGTRG